MSSLVRRIQIGIMKRKGIRKVPILHSVTGNVIGWLWPRMNEVAFTADGRDAAKTEALKPIVDILVEDRNRRLRGA